MSCKPYRTSEANAKSYLKTKGAIDAFLNILNINIQNMLLIILLLTLINIISCKLVYLATFFRHGARYPLGDIYDGN